MLVYGSLFKPMVDFFLTSFSHKLPIYVSPVPDPAAWAVDAEQKDKGRRSKTYSGGSDVASSTAVPGV